MEAAAAAFADGDKGGGAIWDCMKKRPPLLFFLGLGEKQRSLSLSGERKFTTIRAMLPARAAVHIHAKVVASCESSGGDGLSDRVILSPPSTLPFPNSPPPPKKKIPVFLLLPSLGGGGGQSLQFPPDSCRTLPILSFRIIRRD